MFLLCNNNNNKNKLRSHWFTKFDLGGVINLVCHGTPSCGKKILARISLEKLGITTSVKGLRNLNL